MHLHRVMLVLHVMNIAVLNPSMCNHRTKTQVRLDSLKSRSCHGNILSCVRIIYMHLFHMDMRYA